MDAETPRRARRGALHTTHGSDMRRTYRCWCQPIPPDSPRHDGTAARDTDETAPGAPGRGAGGGDLVQISTGPQAGPGTLATAWRARQAHAAATTGCCRALATGSWCVARRARHSECRRRQSGRTTRRTLSPQMPQRRWRRPAQRPKRQPRAPQSSIKFGAVQLHALSAVLVAVLNGDFSLKDCRLP